MNGPAFVCLNIFLPCILCLRFDAESEVIRNSAGAPIAELFSLLLCITLVITSVCHGNSIFIVMHCTQFI